MKLVSPDEHSQFSQKSQIATRNFRNFRNWVNCGFRNFANNAIRFLEGIRNFANNAIEFRALFTFLMETPLTSTIHNLQSIAFQNLIYGFNSRFLYNRGEGWKNIEFSVFCSVLVIDDFFLFCSAFRVKIFDLLLFCVFRYFPRVLCSRVNFEL